QDSSSSLSSSSQQELLLIVIVSPLRLNASWPHDVASVSSLPFVMEKESKIYAIGETTLSSSLLLLHVPPR
ncbi:unnamed protein product, partial [Brassica napus]